MQQGHCMGQRFPLVLAELSGELVIVQTLVAKGGGKESMQD